MADNDPTNASGNAGTGNEQGKSKWEELGFDDEESMIQAARDAADLRRKVEQAEADLEKEKTAKTKTNNEYMRQSNEIGELRKQLKEKEDKLKEAGQNVNATPGEPANKQTSASTTEQKQETDEETLSSLSDEEIAQYDEILNKPENAELKKKVATGGDMAMAEFVRAYRKESPVDLSQPIFARFKQKDANKVPKSSIARAVKELFKQHEQEEQQSLAASPQGGAPVDSEAKTKKQMVVGGVDVEFFQRPKS